MKIPEFLLDQWLNEYHFSSTPPEFDLASSTGPHWALKDLFALMSAAEQAQLRETELIYSPASGSDSLRRAIAEMQGVEADHVQIVTGASEALMVLFCCAAETGGNVVLPFPLFPSTAVVANLFGLETRFYQLRAERKFIVDIDEIISLVDEKTKVLLVNTPHNPTGAILSNEELRYLHDFAVARGVQFVSDEVYHPIYHGEPTGSAAILPQATVLGSFSKSLALSGIRIGWIVEPDKTRLQEYEHARGYFTISNPPVAEKFALVALRNRDEIVSRTQRVADANLKDLDPFFADHDDKLGWIRPRGGLTAFPWLRDGSDTRIFCRALARAGVLLAPGDCFQMPNYFRLGFGVSSNGFARALDRIGDFLNESSLGTVSTANSLRSSS